MTMTDKEIDAAIQQALAEGKKLWLLVTTGNESDRYDFEPYLYGTDVMSHDFLWGYIPQLFVYYKFRFTDIQRAEVSSESIAVDPARLPIEYYYHDDEVMLGALASLYDNGKGDLHTYANKKLCDGE